MEHEVEPPQSQEELLQTNRRRLSLLEKQAAHFGARADPALLMEIEDLRRSIARLEQSLGFSPPSTPDDTDPLSTPSPGSAKAALRQFKMGWRAVAAGGAAMLFVAALVMLAQFQAKPTTPATQAAPIPSDLPKVTDAAPQLALTSAPTSMTTASAVGESDPPIGTPTKESANLLLQEASAWLIVYAETFAGTVNGWSLGPRSSERVTGNKSIVAGRFLWKATALRDEVWWSTPPGNTDSFTDFSVSIDIKRVSGPQSSYTGLAFHYDNPDNLYAVFVREETQRISLSIYQRGKWEDLLAISTSALKTDQANTIRIIAKDALFVVFVNGEYVGGVTDRRIPSGRIYLITTLAKANESVAFEFDNFELRKP
jgi:hypothetical protein